jgi:hypothetical protein
MAQRIGSIAIGIVPVLLTVALYGAEVLGHKWR